MPARRLSELEAHTPFVERHVGPSAAQLQRMLATVGYADLDALTAAVLPGQIRGDRPLDVPPAASEPEMLAELAGMAADNQPLVSMIGAGYSDTVTPAVIRRNVLENPAWYTAYTPYQPEISQGRLEALLTFQTMVGDLTALPVANASLLDEPTAAAEAMALCRRASSAPGAFVVDRRCHPQTLAVLATRAAPLGIDLLVADLDGGLPDGDAFGVLVQYPATDGGVRPLAPLVQAAHGRGALVVAAADLLALTLLRAPGEDGVDVAVGSTQRFGVPMGYGGPHAGYLAVRTGLERSLPGRLVGVTVDAAGGVGYRLALQAREQHIRRERATSNICTAQVLLAVVAAMYAAYHGPEGLRAIAQRVHRYAAVLAAGLRAGGVEVRAAAFFDTVAAVVPGRADEVVEAARRRGVNLRRLDADTVGIACDEVTRREHLQAVWAAVGVPHPDVDALDETTPDALPPELLRAGDYLTHPTFHHYRSETAMMRYLRRLSDRDMALDRSMIPLGSCTMKLNAAAEMEPISWAGFARMHPFAPAEQAAGYRRLIRQLEGWLAEITGYAAVSVQPNAGSQGELAGLLAIRGFLRAKGEEHRQVCLIPSSAHGTNAASAVMAGLRVVVVATDEAGNVDLDDLQRRIDEHRDSLAAIMLTYPSTHGVFEPAIRTICERVHAAGAQVYVDGANLNAMVGLSRPGEWGADVSHLNLHKTFCIPHGGGGPGVGPVAVAAHLVPYLPTTGLAEPGDGEIGGGRVSGAPWGSAGILPISWAYIRMMGPAGLRRASQVAILSANYLATRLREHYPILYTGQQGLVAHECIVDLRPLTKRSGVTVEDVAKRLMDYGFHAPTISFPVAGTMMVEPTESEDLGELDRFVAAMTAIRAEIERVATGEWDRDDNPLRNAPHTAAMLAGEWAHPYSREVAAFPGYSPEARGDKFWPPVRRLDQAYGDRHLMCSCPPLEDYST